MEKFDVELLKDIIDNKKVAKRESAIWDNYAARFDQIQKTNKLQSLKKLTKEQTIELSQLQKDKKTSAKIKADEENIAELINKINDFAKTTSDANLKKMAAKLAKDNKERKANCEKYLNCTTKKEADALQKTISDLIKNVEDGFTEIFKTLNALYKIEKAESDEKTAKSKIKEFSTSYKFNFTGKIDNEITLNFPDGTIRELNQEIEIIKDAPSVDTSTLFDFSHKIGEETNNLANISVDKEGNYRLAILLPDNFKAEDGKLLSANKNIKIEDGKIVLEIDKTNPAISVMSKKDSNDFAVVVKSVDGKEYLFESNAISLNLTIDDKKYSYSIDTEKEDEQCLTTRVNSQKVVEGLLTNESSENTKVFAAPENNSLKDIPSYLFASYFSEMKNNQEKNLGDFLVHSLNFTGKAEDTIYLISQKQKDGRVKTFLFENGTFKPCRGFFFQYDNDPSTPDFKTAHLVLDCGQGNKQLYFNFPIGTMENDSKNVVLLPEGEEALRILAQIDTQNKSGIFDMHYVDGTKSKEPKTYAIVVGDAKFDCKQKDVRSWSNAKFALKASKKTHEIEENNEKQEEKENKPDNKEEKKEAENKEESKEEKKEEKAKITPKKIDERKNISLVADTAAGASIFLIILGLIPGVGPILSMVGMALFASATLVNVYADKFAFSPYVREKKDFDLSELKDYQSEEFIENENELGKIIEKDQALQAEIKEFAKDTAEGGNELANNLKKLYNENSGAYIDGADAEKDKRFDNLLSMSGLAERQDMISQINGITDPAIDEEERNKLINTFMLKHFKNLSESDKNVVKSMFSEENKEDLLNFTNKIQKLNNVQKEEKTQLDHQMVRITKMDDRQLARLVEKVYKDEKNPDAVMEKYAKLITRRYSLDNTLTTAKVEQLINSVPLEKRAGFTTLLNNATKEAQAGLEEAKQIGKEYDENKQKIDNLSNYAKLKKQVGTEKFNETLKKLSAEDQKAIKDAIASDKSKENVEKVIDNVLGTKKFENGEKTYKELLENDELEKKVTEYKDILETRTSYQTDKLQEKLGTNVAKTCVNYYKHDQNYQKSNINPKKTYNNAFDFLVDRFGLDRVKLSEEMALNRYDDKTDEEFLNNMLLKFGYDVEKLKEDATKAKFDKDIEEAFRCRTALSTTQEERVSILQEKYNIERKIQPKCETLNALIQKAQLNIENVDDLVNFCSGFENQVTLQDIVNLKYIQQKIDNEEFKALKPEEKLNVIKSLEVAAKTALTTAREIQTTNVEKEKANISKLNEELKKSKKQSVISDSEQKLIEEEQKLMKNVTASDELAQKIEKICELANKYPPDDIKQLLVDLANCDIKNIMKYKEISHLFKPNNGDLTNEEKNIALDQLLTDTGLKKKEIKKLIKSIVPAYVAKNKRLSKANNKLNKLIDENNAANKLEIAKIKEKIQQEQDKKNSFTKKMEEKEYQSKTKIKRIKDKNLEKETDKEKETNVFGDKVRDKKASDLINGVQRGLSSLGRILDGKVSITKIEVAERDDEAALEAQKQNEIVAETNAEKVEEEKE